MAGSSYLVSMAEEHRGSNAIYKVITYTNNKS
jgi:hypothetical protein